MEEHKQDLLKRMSEFPETFLEESVLAAHAVADIKAKRARENGFIWGSLVTGIILLSAYLLLQ
jgi:hypothetical protein